MVKGEKQMEGFVGVDVARADADIRKFGNTTTEKV